MVKLVTYVKKEVEVNRISISLKVRDNFNCILMTNTGEKVLDYEGYVPGFMPGDHYGDYVNLEIDLNTGEILNWVPPSALTLQCFIEENTEK